MRVVFLLFYSLFTTMAGASSCDGLFSTDWQVGSGLPTRIRVAVLSRKTPERQRELAQLIDAPQTIFYLHPAPFDARLQIIDTKTMTGIEVTALTGRFLREISSAEIDPRALKEDQALKAFGIQSYRDLYVRLGTPIELKDHMRLINQFVATAEPLGHSTQSRQELKAALWRVAANLRTISAGVVLYHEHSGTNGAVVFVGGKVFSSASPTGETPIIVVDTGGDLYRGVWKGDAPPGALWTEDYQGLTRLGVQQLVPTR